jgi:hypothetical protein
MLYFIIAGKGFKLSLWTKSLKLLDCAFRGAAGISPASMRVRQLDPLFIISSEVETSLAKV